MAQLRIRKLPEDVTSKQFTCGVESIDDMVYRSYFTTILQHAYAYEVSAKNIVLGYYMIVFKKIILDDYPDEISEYRDLMDDCISVHIKYIAVDKKFQGHKIGTSILDQIIKRIFSIITDWPIRLITLDAIRDKCDWYKRMGFKVLDETQFEKGDYTVAMYMDCITNKQLINEYIERKVMI